MVTLKTSRQISALKTHFTMDLETTTRHDVTLLFLREN